MLKSLIHCSKIYAIIVLELSRQLQRPATQLRIAFASTHFCATYLTYAAPMSRISLLNPSIGSLNRQDLKFHIILKILSHKYLLGK